MSARPQSRSEKISALSSALPDTPSSSMRAALPQPSQSEPPRASDVVAAIPLETCDDAVVVERLLAGDQRAEAELYRRYAPLLGRAVERLLRSSQDAQDVLQDTFVIALEEIRRLRDPSAIRGWLLQIAV